MTKGCGFCRDVRMFFSLLTKHLKNFAKDFNSYRGVCDIAADMKPAAPLYVPKIVRDIREQAHQNFKGVVEE